MILPMTRRQLRTIALGLALSAAGGLGLVALASAANAADAPPGPPPHGMAGPMGGGMGLPGLPLAGPMSQRLLDEVEATPQQREQLRQIAEAARADLKAQFESNQAGREQMLAWFIQPTPDAKAAEGLRKQMLARQEAAGKRMTQAMVQSAQVLTLEQRQKMAELIRQRAERMPPHARADRPDGPVPR